MMQRIKMNTLFLLGLLSATNAYLDPWFELQTVLSNAMDTWNQVNIKHYTFELDEPLMDATLNYPWEVTVIDGGGQTAVDSHKNPVLHSPTIVNLFDLIQLQITNKEPTIEVEYASGYGYPYYIKIIKSDHSVWECGVTNFAPLN